MKLIAIYLSTTFFPALVSSTQNFPKDKLSNNQNFGFNDLEGNFVTPQKGDVFEESVKMYPHEFTLSEPELAEERLKSFIERLQTYMNESNFDVDKFERNAKDFQREIYEIEKPILDLFHYRQLSEKLWFAKHVFRVMVDSIKNLKIYHSTGTLEQHLVHCVILLNVRLFDLYDSQGFPHISKPGFEEKVGIHRQSLKFWNGIFTRLRDIPLGTNVMYVNQYNRASITLKTLEDAISGE